MIRIEADQSGAKAGEPNGDGREVLVRLEADYAADGDFGKRVLEVDAEEVRVIDGAGAVLLRIPIGEIKSARNEPLVGGGRMEITTKAEVTVAVLSYSLSIAAQFSEAARGIEQLAKGEPLLINLKKERMRCEKCNRLLPEKDGICPACINRRKTVMRIAGYLMPYSKQALFLAFLAICTTLLNLIPPFLQGAIVDRVVLGHAASRSSIVDRVFSAPSGAPLLIELMAGWLSLLVAGVGLQIVTGRTTAWLGGNIAADIRSSVYRAIEFLQLAYFDKKQVGAITSRVTQDTDRIWGFLVDGMPYFVSNGLVTIFILTILFLTNWKLALCLIAPLPCVTIIGSLYWKTVSQLYMRVGQKWARFHMHLNESLTGIRVVKAFAQEDLENAKFTNRNRDLRNAGVRADSRWFTVFGAMSLFTGMGALINWSVGGYLVYKGEMTMGVLVRNTGFINLLYGPLQWFAQVNNWFSRAIAGAERVFEVIDTEKEPYLRSTNAVPIKGNVEFKNVRFGYDKSNPILKGMNFTARPGDMIGLVGKSGAGKSTTINLLCRFYEPDSGEIAIDGMDYRDMSLQAMRAQVGIVLQEPFLFNGTIRENIAYGKPGASMEEIMRAAKAANAHSFILSKPDGYDTMVGERGNKLSGGERQRVSIARAILHDPRILILDEATSSVDVETEKQIQEAIGRLIEGRTTFAIAHRLSTLRNATKLIVLEKGEIVEMGTHAELMEKQGTFYNLVQTQSQINEIIGYGAA
jgi:ATP-binding cassette subfamily B protein